MKINQVYKCCDTEGDHLDVFTNAEGCVWFTAFRGEEESEVLVEPEDIPRLIAQLQEARLPKDEPHRHVGRGVFTQTLTTGDDGVTAVPRRPSSNTCELPDNIRNVIDATVKASMLAFWDTPLPLISVVHEVKEEGDSDPDGVRYFHDQRNQHWFTYDPKKEEAERAEHRASCKEVTKAEYDEMLERNHHQTKPK